MTATELNPYEAQAEAFLTKHAVTFRATRSNVNTCPPYCDRQHIHGDRYTITLRKEQRRLTFAFWNSLHAQQTGEPLTAYDVLACLSSDAFCPDTFEDFCAEYGYDVDSRKAWSTFLRCAQFAQRLHAFFTEEELQDLATIA